MYAALAILVTVLILAVAVVAVLTLRRAGTGRAAGVAVVLQRGPDGETVVPVRGLFKGGAHNNLRPFLAITPDGIRFRIIFEDRWNFADLARIDAGPALFGASVSFKSRSHGTLSASVADLQVARQVLQALPRDVELTPRAAALREGAPSAA